MSATSFKLAAKSFLAILLTLTGIMTEGAAKKTDKNYKLKTPSYKTVTEVYDWGPVVSKLILDMGTTLKSGSVDADTFKVHVVRTDSRKDVILPKEDQEGDREVTKVYVSDKDGNSTDSGNYITIEMKVHPNTGLEMSIYYEAERYKANAWVNSDYTLTQQKDINTNSGTLSGLIINQKTADIKRYVDDYKIGSFTDSENNISVKYASFTPEKDGKKKPLIIWLRGAGEVGTDPLMPLLSNKACQFSSPKMQKLFGGAYVLIPQYHTIWMEGSVEKAVMALIKKYVSENSDIDTNRIYLGGNSNGGYLGMALLRDYPDYFAAGVLACEAMPDRLITDSQIQQMKNIPIWLTVAKNDPDIPPETYTLATYKRLVAAGAKNVHLSLFDNVVDTSGLYKKADGSPFEYYGHFSFMYVFNDECVDTINGKKTAVFEWLASQSKAKKADSSSNTEVIKISSTNTQKTGNKFPIYIIPVAAAALIGAVILIILKIKHS
jgi:predicted peptidase